MIRPIPAAATFRDPDYNIWCGSMVCGNDGKSHLFYSRWRRALGHLAWVTSSEIAHAVADHPQGPYRHVDVALPPRGQPFWDGLCTHNPTVIRVEAKYYLYYMGNTGDGKTGPSLNWTNRNNQRIGVAMADSPYGPWQRFDTPLVQPTPDFYDALCCTNPTVTPRLGGGFLMIYKSVGNKGKPPFGGPVVHIVATSDSPTGPFIKQPQPVFTKDGVAFPVEDPFVWRGADRYWAVVRDIGGYFTGRGSSLALFESPDGLDWKAAAHPFVSTTAVVWADGRHTRLDALERPQVWLEDGVPKALFCAAAADPRRDGSYNIHIPLAPPEQHQ
jgi:hypothetical protein